uniref:Uncharacterized protein n=1 Tax=Cannabis sativa TaxID=3483 RepID=A0A803P5J6_CANSA
MRDSSKAITTRGGCPLGLLEESPKYINLEEAQIVVYGGYYPRDRYMHMSTRPAWGLRRAPDMRHLVLCHPGYSQAMCFGTVIIPFWKSPCPALGAPRSKRSQGKDRTGRSAKRGTDDTHYTAADSQSVCTLLLGKIAH